MDGMVDDGERKRRGVGKLRMGGYIRDLEDISSTLWQRKERKARTCEQGSNYVIGHPVIRRRGPWLPVPPSQHPLQRAIKVEMDRGGQLLLPRYRRLMTSRLLRDVGTTSTTMWDALAWFSISPGGTPSSSQVRFQM